ncbi:MAG: hypothetical protein HUJ65_06985, partial [Oscillospiraceae bacterium]|nr:hypothetical protein [Oscillospiraceae bacterium]
NLEVNAVEIRIPAALLQERSGDSLLPESVGVPYGTKDAPVQTDRSYFNYYTESVDGVTYLVFFNYERLEAGTNATIQVLYPMEPAFDVIDGTEWSLTPEVNVVVRVPDSSGEGYTRVREHESLKPLTGTVDTHAEVSNGSKVAYIDSEHRYTPMLYTYKQISRYVKVSESDVDLANYAYAVWQVSADVTYNQPSDIYFNETAFFTEDRESTTRLAGEVVGVSGMTRRANMISLLDSTTEPVSGGDYNGKYYVGSITEAPKNGTTTERLYWYVVTAYPRDQIVDNESIFHNEVDIILHPADDLDPDTETYGADECTYRIFVWNHPSGMMDFFKVDDEAHPSWTTVYKAVSDMGQPEGTDGRDYGGIEFDNMGIIDAFMNTHDNPEFIKTEGHVHTYEYIPDTYDTLITVDDFVHANVDSVERGGDESIVGDYTVLSTM